MAIRQSHGEILAKPYTKALAMLTREPATMSADDVDALRQAGLNDREVHDVAHVAAYFAYVNRVVLGLGAELGTGEGAVGEWPGSNPRSDPTPRSF